MTLVAVTETTDRPAFAAELLRLAAGAGEGANAVQHVELGYEVSAAVAAGFVAADARTRWAGIKAADSVEELRAGKVDRLGEPAIPAPTAPGAAYAQAEAQSAVAAINSIRAALTKAGITL
jgi:hypothetical protein